MKKTVLIISAFAAVIVGTAFDIQSDNGKAGYTGSVGETTCVSCHNSFGPSNSGPGNISIRTNLPNGNQYIPGQTYTIHVVVHQTGRSLFGMGFEALTPSKTNAGTLVITNTATTQIKTKTVSGVVRENVVHQFNGGAHTDSMDFVFNWIAPTTNVGDVTFTTAGISADADGSESGDYVYNEIKIITGASGTGISELNSVNTLSVVPAPTEHLLHLNYENAGNEETFIFLHDMNGRRVLEQSEGRLGSGIQKMEVDLPNGLQSGIYLVTVKTGAKQITRKVSILF